MEKVSPNFGPIDGLLQDETVSEIMVNQFDRVFVERDGKLQLSSTKFSSEQELRDLISNIAKASGREIGTSKPYLDSYLSDGSRVNAVFPPMAPKGANLTIRKFRRKPFSLDGYIQSGTITHKIAYFLHACILARVNIVVSGGTGTGKTTFLNTLAALVPTSERIVSIEDVAELAIPHPNWVRLESVHYGPGAGVSTRDCLINSLRMRPDRIVVGECRRDETFEMLQAMNTGHDGSMTTVHANSTRDCLARMESLIMTSNIDIPIAALRRQMASAIDIIVQLKRLKTGQRVVEEIMELTGIEQNVITTQDIFSRDKITGIESTQLSSTGLVPTFMDKFSDTGIQFPPNFFDPKTEITYQPD
ncbi:MAG: Flp pilus assembly complex ATPase component TadA [Oligoflexia bacterium]|nr:Flp pilus assembly complex ATPase component TadA [Oligoflexia bacterium]